jgi:ABC-type transport system substrate-binding protein
LIRESASIEFKREGEVMNRKLLKSAAMALALGAGLATFARAADTPSQGGTIVVTYKDDMATLDPAIGYDWQNWSMINGLFSRLVDYKFGTTEIVPLLADSWTISPDGLVYTFKLNPKAKFTNGRKVTAADIKYSIERSVNPKTQGPGGGFYHSIVGQDKMADGSATTISGIETPDESTVKFTLSQPDATFLNVLALNFSSAVPKEVVEAEGADFGKKPVGSGAFKLDEWVPGQRLVFSRNADFFGNRPNLDGFRVEIGQEPLVATLRLQKGEVDIAGDGIPPAKYLEIKNSTDAKDMIVDREQFETSYITINTTKKPMDDVRVRKAINMAINKDRIVRIINGRATPAGQVLPPLMPGYDEA